MRSTGPRRRSAPIPSPRPTSRSGCCSARRRTGMRCSSPIPARAMTLPLRAQALRDRWLPARRSAGVARAHARGRRLRQRAEIRVDRLWPQVPRSVAPPDRGRSREAGANSGDVHRKRLHERHRGAPTPIARRFPRETRSFELVGARPRSAIPASPTCSVSTSWPRQWRGRATARTICRSTIGQATTRRLRPGAGCSSRARSSIAAIGSTAACRSGAAGGAGAAGRELRLAFTPGLLASLYRESRRWVPGSAAGRPRRGPGEPRAGRRRLRRSRRRRPLVDTVRQVFFHRRP